MTTKRTHRVAAAVVLLAGLAAVVVGVARQAGAAEDKAVPAPTLLPGCGGASARHQVPSVEVEDAPAATTELIRSAARRVGTTLVTSVRLAAPPDPEFTPLPGYPGDRWLYVDVRLDGLESCRVAQDWQAARLAGAVRNAAAAASLPIPFGYTTTGVLPDGRRSEPISIAIGAPLGTEPVALPDRAAEAARIHRAVAAAGLELRSLSFAGADGAAVIRATGAGAATDVVRTWLDVIHSLVGTRPDSAWMVEIDGADGAPIKAFANAPSTAGAVGWSRPDLRVLDLEVTNGG